MSIHIQNLTEALKATTSDVYAHQQTLFVLYAFVFFLFVYNDLFSPHRIV